jgi:hypothetical protein
MTSTSRAAIVTRTNWRIPRGANSTSTTTSNWLTRLCTRCHAKKIPDWRAGVHGKRTGYWHGPKEYQTCVACHDPHSPLFKPLEPKPPPIPAEKIRRSKHAELGEVENVER